MADDWDLFAVVRSCTNSTSTATTSAAAATTTCSNPARTVPFVNLQEEGDHPFYFPGVTDEREDSFQGLHEIYKELYLESAVAAPREEFQNQTNINEQQEKNQHHLPIRHGIHILASSAPINNNNNNSFPSTNNNIHQSGRPRRRKNQQGKVSHHMSQEELSSDSWAWRKYGQKPIKGSPFPRNYYRCSTSKGCPARKQVERSPTDPDIFVVSYSGEHTHPRPTHRSSLAGSTRTKLSNSPSTKAPPTTTMTSTNALITTTTNTSSSSSSPVVISATCLDQNVDDDDDENPAEIATTSSGNIIEDDDDDEEEEEDILIPSSFITRDILKGFQELS